MTGLRAGQLTSLERLYRRRIPPTSVLTPDVAKVLARFTHELQRPIGLVITRRGTIQEVLIGAGTDPSQATVAKFRASSRSLRGLRLIRAQLRDELLSQEDLTTLALLRLDMVGALAVTEQGEPGLLSLAHLLPPNPAGQLCKLLKPTTVYGMTNNFGAFMLELEADLQEHARGHAVSHDRKTAILVSASPASRAEQEDRLEELAELATSAGVTVIERIVQRTQEGYHRCQIGSGKLKETLIRALQQGVDLLVFDQELSPAQMKAIADLTDMTVIDRTQLILDIFARRAHSREGKIQVELAQLRYLLPRLTGRGATLSRLGGGIGARGPGETKLETDRRRIRDRIAHLEKELSRFARQQGQRRARRMRHALPVISIVGYTNAGKSTLLNVLTDSHVRADDRVFETLDTTSRRLRFPRDREVIVTDTVGFIRDLPKELLGAFRTTLEELRDADLLLHVVDAGARDLDVHLAAVDRILRELEFDHIPRVLVFNKCDRLPGAEVELLCRRYHAVGVSALHPETLHPLLRHLEQRLAGHHAFAPVEFIKPGLSAAIASRG